ncbi:MAG: putative addiction module antidote protein [Gammaproteobacteria bacterium]|nr:putative addiction module antidote protein [Gammaproteobacteria bacterium]
MEKITITPFEASDYLESEEDMKMYLQICIEEDGIKGFQHALGVIAKAKGMNEIAKETGLSRQNLYKSLSDNANPRIETVEKVAKALGMKLTAVPA